MKLQSFILCLFLYFSNSIHGSEQPNIILVFVDDLGYSDIGCYGNDFVDTPNIDKLADDGLKFTDFYAAGAVCSPTRCAVQSGQNQARIGITAHIPGHWRPFERVITPIIKMALPQDTVTVAESLKESGYKTGYIGKWHLGNGAEFQPDQQGYDETAVISGPHLPGKYRVIHGDKSIKPKKGQYRTDFEADLGINFIQKHKDNPFFLMMSPYAVHIVLAAMSEKVEKYRAKSKEMKRELPHPVYAAMIEHVDDMVGRLVAELDKQNITKKTMIIFTSDNGGLYRRYDYNPNSDDNVTTNAPLKGEKGMLYEGGVRVPLIVKYPGVTTPGSVCEEPTISYDFYPTFVDAAGGALPKTQTIDGLSFMPLLKNPKQTLKRDALYWHYPHYHHHRPASSIRDRDWKLIEYLDGTNEVELFNLSQDIGEQSDLSKDKKGMVSHLKQKLKKWRASVLAAMPIANPSYDPERAHEWWNRTKGTILDSSRRKPFPQTEKDL